MLRAIVCRIRDIFSIRTPPKSSVSGAPGGVTPRGAAAATCSFVSRTMGPHVFGRDAAAVARGPHAAQIDAQLPREPAHGRAGRGGRMAVARTSSSVFAGAASFCFRVRGRGFFAAALLRSAAGSSARLLRRLVRLRRLPLLLRLGFGGAAALLRLRLRLSWRPASLRLLRRRRSPRRPLRSP